MAEIVDAFGDPPPRKAVERAAAALAAGRVVVLPTDTVYGLAVDPRQEDAVDRLYAIKRRPSDTALPVLVASIDQALALAGDELPAGARRLMERYWPGPLTVVVTRREGLGLSLGGDDRTVGLRLPAAPVPVALATAGGPLAVTSANLHGRPTPEALPDVLEQLGDDGETGLLALDAGPCRGVASTVVACLPAGEMQVLREGALTSDEVLQVSGSGAASEAGTGDS